MPPRLLRQLDHFAQEGAGSRPAVRDRAAPDAPLRTISWARLRDAAARLAVHLREELELEPGAVVLLALPNRAEFHAACMGVFGAGMAAFPVAPTRTAAELADAADRASAAAVIGPAAVCDALAGRTPHRLDIDTLDLFSCQAQSTRGPLGGGAWASANASRTALLLQSSGTTGLPKIVRRLGRSLDAEADNCARVIGLTEADRVLAVAPLCHSYGIEHGLLMPMIAGATVELPPATDPHTLMRELVQREATTFPAVPFIFESIVSCPDFPPGAGSPAPPTPTAADPPASAASLACLKRAYSAGGPLPRSVAEAFHERFGLRIGQVFGSTEVGSVTYADPAAPGFDPDSVGPAMRGVDLRIVDRDAPDLAHPLPRGEEGRLAIAAPSMLDAYVDDPHPPAPEGYFFTGDLASLGAHGNLRLTGRVKLLINVGGRKVNPAEVEAVLTEHPRVREAVVLPLAVTRTVSRLRAVVVPRAPVSENEVDVEELRRFVRERLSSYKVPRLIEVRQDLPRSASGKVLREALA